MSAPSLPTALSFCLLCDDGIARDTAGTWWHVTSRALRCSADAPQYPMPGMTLAPAAAFRALNHEPQGSQP